MTTMKQAQVPTLLDWVAYKLSSRTGTRLRKNLRATEVAAIVAGSGFPAGG